MPAISPFRPGRALARVVTRIAALLSVASLAACDIPLPGGLGGGRPVATGETVQVAMLLPYGSGSAGDATIAQSLENAARLAQAEGANVEITVYNTAANPQTAAAQATQAIAAGAQIILGPLRSDGAVAVGNAVAGSGVPVVSFSNNTDVAGGNVMILGNTFANTARRMVGYAAAQGRNRILVVRPRNLAGEVAEQAILSAAAGSTAQIAGVLSYEFSQAGVVEATPQVVSQIQTLGANALLLTSDSAGALPFFAQLLPENGYDPAAAQLMGLTRWDIPAQTLTLAGLQGGWFALPDPAATNAFNARYQAAYGESPHPLGALGYDGIVAATAAAASGGLGVAQLAGTGSLDGAGGAFRLLPDGTVARALAVAQVANQSVTILDPAPRRIGGAGS